MMKKIILICLANIMLYCANGQTLVNNGALVAVTPGGVMSVKTDNTTTGSGSLENIAGTTGILRNAGFVLIEGSFVNTSGVADGFGTNTGEYMVQVDWENNATFKADSSTVNLYGSLPQQITGSSITTFYNLTDSNPGVKTQTIDANVAGTLTINSVEHATANNLLTILNADPLAIAQNTVNDAFVSSTGNGRLIRNTNQKAEYIFPTGISEAGGAKIREASITPPNTTPRAYSVRYADNTGTTNTTTTDGYDTAQKSGYISEVNDVYYHVISANGNTDPADLGIFYDPAADQAWQSIGRWQGTPVQWQDLQNTVTVSGQSGSTRMKVVKSAWIPSSDTAHALVDTIAIKVDFNFPTAFVGDCAGCSGGTASAGNNGVFGIINQGNIVTLQELSVFNRWGEMVFDSKRDGASDWNGHFNGKLAAQGNYVYRAVVTNNQSGKQYPLVTGNVALLW
jgi:gliding motility-associated-like protein